MHLFDIIGVEVSCQVFVSVLFVVEFDCLDSIFLTL
jgi:hypothetical protein